MLVPAGMRWRKGERGLACMHTAGRASRLGRVHMQVVLKAAKGTSIVRAWRMAQWRPEACN